MDQATILPASCLRRRPGFVRAQPASQELYRGACDDNAYEHVITQQTEKTKGMATQGKTKSELVHKGCNVCVCAEVMSE